MVEVEVQQRSRFVAKARLMTLSLEQVPPFKMKPRCEVSQQNRLQDTTTFFSLKPSRTPNLNFRLQSKILEAQMKTEITENKEEQREKACIFQKKGSPYKERLVSIGP